MSLTQIVPPCAWTMLRQSVRPRPRLFLPTVSRFFDDPITLPLGGQTDLRVGRGVFDGVACQIHQDLDDQTRIGPHKQDFL